MNLNSKKKKIIIIIIIELKSKYLNCIFELVIWTNQSRTLKWKSKQFKGRRTERRAPATTLPAMVVC